MIEVDVDEVFRKIIVSFNKRLVHLVCKTLSECH